MCRKSLSRFLEKVDSRESRSGVTTLLAVELVLRGTVELTSVAHGTRTQCETLVDSEYYQG